MPTASSKSQNPSRRYLLQMTAFLALIFLLSAAKAQAPAATFTGSLACKSCHERAYDGWSKTRMANVVRDPKVHPEAVLGDFAHPTDAVTFKLDDVAFT